MSAPRQILVTGASRGLGLEFTRQWLAAGRKVYALARDPQASPGLRELAEAHAGFLFAVPCDVTQDASVMEARVVVESETLALDAVVNNAAIYGKKRVSIDDLRLDRILPVMEVNTIGALRVTQAFLPLLRAGADPRLIHVTSLMGSLGDNSSGGSYAYRMSKAALNMASRNLSHELRSDGILSAVVHPGWVQTDMGGPQAPLATQDSVAAMIRTIEGLDLEGSGGFYDRDGQALPW